MPQNSTYIGPVLNKTTEINGSRLKIVTVCNIPMVSWVMQELVRLLKLIFDPRVTKI